MKLCATVLPWLIILFSTEGFCEQRVHCQWGPFGAWSECDGCTKSQSRSRPIAVFSQFGGNLCSGGSTETRSCETTRSCPLEEGCGSWFRCLSGKCISQSLVCNGDQDCEEDAQDERVCGIMNHKICRYSVPPPNIELIGLGFDMVLGTWRGSVINTKSFGGQCNTIYSGSHRAVYRLPFSTTQFSFLVTVKNDFSDEMFTSKWHYAKDIVNRETVTGTTTGFKNYDYHLTDDNSQTHKVVILKNDIEVAQFQSNTPQNLPISEEFWKALGKLPSVYDYSAYKRVLERFGTHYVSEGSLGGSFKVVTTVDVETENRMVSMWEQQNECVRTKRWILFFPVTRVDCSSGSSSHSSNTGTTRGEPRPAIVTVEGGRSSTITALKTLQVSDTNNNWEKYSNWADSVKDYPVVTKQKLRPLSELVKEVHCAGVKKLYLRRAIEQYISENDACHCRPCRNNGIPVMKGEECKCICKPNTSGLACEIGTEVEGQPGVIDGRWSCWSAWSQCSGGQRSRSRSCSNPSPLNGGQDCIGATLETSGCDDDALEHLKTMEPQCFDSNLQALPKCKPPPALIFGYVLDPKDSYYVGSQIQYTCTSGFYLVGNTILECTSNQTWSGTPGACTTSRCTLATLADGVIASPMRKAYGIGESVTLSCSDGRRLQGEGTAICSASLLFSPNPADVKCSPVITIEVSADTVSCKPWEKPVGGQCVCKMPFECSSSFTFCATTTSGSKKSVLLNACKMHALQCMGKSFTIAEDSDCQWPERNTTGCVGCYMWENCDDQTNECRCKDSADCSSSGLDVCVHVGEDKTTPNQTMSECEAGHRQCKGEKVKVVSIAPCTS